MSCRAFAVFAVLVLGAGSASAQTDRGITPTVQLKGADEPPQPYIDGYDVSACAQPGQVVTVFGRDLTPRGSRQAVLGGRELHIDLRVIRWEERRLAVTIPADPRVAPGARYFIAIEAEQHGRWLSNIDKPLTICRGAAQDQDPAAPDPAPPGHAEDPPPAPGDPASPSTPRDNGPDRSGARVVPEPVEEPPDPQPPPPDEVTPAQDPFAGASSGGEVSAPAPLLQPRADDAADIEPAELLVWHPDLDAAQTFAGELQALGWSVRRRLPLQGLGVVQTTIGLPPGTSVAAARSELETRFPDLLVDANHLYRPLAAADDQVPLQLVGWSPLAAQCAADKQVGIIDTLVTDSHPAFDGRDIVVHSVLPAGIELADDSHGTAVAARLAELLPVAALRVAGVFRQREQDEADTTAEWLLLALDWLMREGVDAVNLSLGGPPNRLLAAGVERVVAGGTGVVAAVGDGGPTSAPVYPAALPGVVGVTAVSQDRRVYRRARHGDEVDLAAPGVDVRIVRPDGSVAYATGTSYAAPFATAAWLLASDRDALFASAEDLGAPGRDPVFGAGLVRFDRLCSLPPTTAE